MIKVTSDSGFSNLVTIKLFSFLQLGSLVSLFSLSPLSSCVDDSVSQVPGKHYGTENLSLDSGGVKAL